MKTRTKKILLGALISLFGILGFFGFGIYYGINYSHQHCIKQIGLAFPIYAADHFSATSLSAPTDLAMLCCCW